MIFTGRCGLIQCTKKLGHHSPRFYHHAHDWPSDKAGILRSHRISCIFGEKTSRGKYIQGWSGRPIRRYELQNFDKEPWKAINPIDRKSLWFEFFLSDSPRDGWPAFYHHLIGLRKRWKGTWMVLKIRAVQVRGWPTPMINLTCVLTADRLLKDPCSAQGWRRSPYGPRW